MSWLDAWPQVLVAALVLLAPGAAVAVSAGARGIVGVAAAAPISVGVIGVAAIVAEPLRLLMPVVVLAVTALAAAVAAVARRATGPVDRDRALVWRGWGVGLAVAAVLLAWRVGTALISPTSFSQHFDIVFHLNGVRRALDGSGSSLTMGSLQGESGVLSFYPVGWHDAAAFVAQLTGLGGPDAVTVSASAVNLIVAAVVWPLGCLALVRVVAGPRPLALVFAGLFSAAFGTFPLRMLDWGVLLPYFLGLALAPAVLALVIAGCRLRPGPDARRAWLLLLPAAAGMALAHTSAVPIVLALSSPAVVMALLRLPRRRIPALAGYGVLVVVIWVLARPQNGFAGWDPTRTLPEALLTFAAGIPLGGLPPVAAVLAAAVTVAVTLLRRRGRWLIWMGGIAGLLYVAASGLPRSPVRTSLAGPWYEDVFRVAAIVVVPAVLFAAVGADLAVRRGLLALRRRGIRRRSVLVAAVVLALVPATQVPVQRDADTTRLGYVLDVRSVLVTPNELALFGRLAEEVPAGAVIANNPWDGSALAYAFAERQVLLPHILYTQSADQRVITQRLRDADTDPAVCEAVRRTGVRFALDLGRPVQDVPDAFLYPGLADLASSGAVEEVDREGDAVLYRVTACD